MKFVLVKFIILFKIGFLNSKCFFVFIVVKGMFGVLKIVFLVKVLVVKVIFVFVGKVVFIVEKV